MLITGKQCHQTLQGHTNWVGLLFSPTVNSQPVAVMTELSSCAMFALVSVGKCCRDADAVSSVAFSQMVRLSPVEVVTTVRFGMSALVNVCNLARTYRWAWSLSSDGILASGSSAHTVRLCTTVSAAKLCPVILAESCQLSWVRR